MLTLFISLFVANVAMNTLCFIFWSSPHYLNIFMKKKMPLFLSLDVEVLISPYSIKDRFGVIRSNEIMEFRSLITKKTPEASPLFPRHCKDKIGKSATTRKDEIPLQEKRIHSSILISSCWNQKTNNS